MEQILKKIIEGNKFELTINTELFDKEAVLMSAYNFLDKGYFLFSIDEAKNIIVQFQKKEGIEEESEKIILDFTDELLNVYLRTSLEKNNKEIKDEMLNAVLDNAVDMGGYVELEVNKGIGNLNSDVEDILKDLENDPELQIDEDEIKKLISEVNTSTDSDPILNIDNLKDVKKKFQDR